MSTCLKCPTRAFQKTQFCRRHYEEVYQVHTQLRKEELLGDSLEYYLRRHWSTEIIKNKKLPNTEYRPDFHFVLGGYLFIVEIDEHQHRRYPKKDELNRQGKLLEHCHSLIRFNPDKYDHGDKHYPAIWTRELKILAPGKIADVVSFNEEEFTRRVDILKLAIDYQIQQLCLEQKPGNLCLVCFNSQ